MIGHLLTALNAAGTTNLPDVDPVFAAAEPAAGPADRAQLAILKAKLDAIVAQTQGQLTHAFRRPFAYAAIFALLVLPLLALRRVFARRRDSEPPAPAAV